MSKKKNHKRHFVGIMKQAQEPIQDSPEWIAMHAKRAMDYIAPLVQSHKMDPGAALLLAAGIMDYNITGKERGIPEDELLRICNVILGAWQSGLFAPGKQYPHTLEDTLAAIENDGNEAES